MRRPFLRLLSVFRSGRAEADLAREIEAHLRLLEDKYVAGGMTRDDARLAARRAFGGQVEQAKLRHRDARSVRWIDESWLDLKLGVRMLVRYPGLAVVAVFALAVAIGSGAAYLEFVNDMYRPVLPVSGGERIVGIQNFDPSTVSSTAGGYDAGRDLYDFRIWQTQLKSVEHLGARTRLARNLITADGRSEPVDGVEISASAFQMMEAPPLLGRPLIATDEQESAPPVVVIGESLWRARFNADAGVVGQTIRLGTVTHTIVGVMPKGFGFPLNQNLWVPFHRATADVRRGEGPQIAVFGKLATGVRLETAQAELDAIARQLAASAPEASQQIRPLIQPYVESLLVGAGPGGLRWQQIALYSFNLIFVGLLAVCGANVATLVFARTAMREGEITVRTALGASRSRIVAQLFAEALVMSVLAAAAGLTVVSYGSRWGMETFLAAAADGAAMPFWWSDTLSSETWLYAIGLAVFAAIISGVVPAMKATGVRMQARLSHAAGRGASMKFGGVWTTVIVAQIALTVLLLMIGVTVGWDAYAGRYLMRGVSFPRAEYVVARLDMDRDQDSQTRFAAAYQEFERRLLVEPGVSTVVHASSFPGMGFERFVVEFLGIESPLGFDGEPLGVQSVSVGANFFEALNAPLVSGRAFTQAEVDGARKVAIVDETFVQLVLGGRNAIGQQVRQPRSADRPEPGPWYEIVGVVADLTRAPGKMKREAVLYLPGPPMPSGRLHAAVHVAGDTSAFGTRLRAIAADVDPTLRLYDVMRLDQVNALEELGTSFFLRMIVGASAVALILATAGVYALISFTVTRRTREIGIRIAVGADSRRIFSGIFSRAFAQVGLGLALGSIPGAALVATSAPSGFTGSGPAVAAAAVVAIAAFILGVTLVACWVPLRRALRIDPTEALRST